MRHRCAEIRRGSCGGSSQSSRNCSLSDVFASWAAHGEGSSCAITRPTQVPALARAGTVTFGRDECNRLEHVVYGVEVWLRRDVCVSAVRYTYDARREVIPSRRLLRRVACPDLPSVLFPSKTTSLTQVHYPFEIPTHGPASMRHY
jgi:hypothetical protein